MSIQFHGRAAALDDVAPPADARARVTALYAAHALGLVRLAHVMLGDRAAAEDQQVLRQQVPSQPTSPRQTSTTGTAGVGR